MDRLSGVVAVLTSVVLGLIMAVAAGGQVQTWNPGASHVSQVLALGVGGTAPGADQMAGQSASLLGLGILLWTVTAGVCLLTASVLAVSSRSGRAAAGRLARVGTLMALTLAVVSWALSTSLASSVELTGIMAALAESLPSLPNAAVVLLGLAALLATVRFRRRGGTSAPTTREGALPA